DTTPPVAPILSLPADNAAGIRAIPTFTWAVAATANAYQFQIDDNTDFSSPAYSTSDVTPIAITSVKPTGLSALTPYYWHVRTRDAAGNWGDWSVSRTITILPVIPTAPVLTAPASGTLTRITTPTLTWNSVAGGVTYQVQVDNQSTFVSPEISEEDTGGVTAFTAASPIVVDGLYYWRVRAVNAAGEPGAWSAARYFTVDTNPPAAPVLSLPADNSAGLRAIPLFTWGAAATASAYQFQFDDNADFSSPTFSTPDGTTVPGTPIAVTSYKPAAMDVLIPYYWHVRARDAAGNWGPWSAARTVTISPIVPGAPTFVYPPIYGLTNDTTPTFTWNAVTAGALYQIQVDNLSTFTSPEVDETVSGGLTAFTPSFPITPDGLYYWRVRAFNALGETGAWSTPRYFTVDTAPPPIPVLSSPADNVAGLRVIPYFYWTAAATAAGYQFAIDDNADFSSPVYSTPDGVDVPGTPITTTYARPTGLVTSTPYYWHVRARDQAGNWSDWSAARTITIQP
ncbi:MAG: hypothetical protein GYA12_12950, partial [Chloroflexi bacterium]|nr:hypothetical protein [Chloroflexota bacterium]